MRGALRTAIVAGVLAVTPGPAMAQLARELLATKVTWVDAASNTGTMIFQGTVDGGGNLDGRVYADGIELAVTGAVAPDGAVSGSLDTLENGHIGTFAAQLNAQQELVGDLVIDGQLECLWDAPADDLPEI